MILRAILTVFFAVLVVGGVVRSMQGSFSPFYVPLAILYLSAALAVNGKGGMAAKFFGYAAAGLLSLIGLSGLVYSVMMPIQGEDFHVPVALVGVVFSAVGLLTIPCIMQWRQER